MDFIVFGMQKGRSRFFEIRALTLIGKTNAIRALRAFHKNAFSASIGFLSKRIEVLHWECRCSKVFKQFVSVFGFA